MASGLGVSRKSPSRVAAMKAMPGVSLRCWSKPGAPGRWPSGVAWISSTVKYAAAAWAANSRPAEVWEAEGYPVGGQDGDAGGRPC